MSHLRRGKRVKGEAGARLTCAAALLCCIAGPLWAQAPYAEGPLLDAVRLMPEGSWKRVNVNSYSSAWTPSALRPLYRTSVVEPTKIISAWSSFAWDSNRGDLILYGGGHANYSGNDVYRWRSRTLQWERAALPSETTFVGSNTWTAVDGADAAPTSAHTYDNSIFLPLADRFLTFGGAIYNTGGAYTRPSEVDPSVLRYTGPYVFDPSKSDANKVGGTTGSHVQRVAPYPGVVGGEMWQNRDMFKHLASSVLPKSHVNGCTAYSRSGEPFDVVYVAARTNASATALDLYRYQVTDVSNPALDVMTRVGRYYSSPSAQTTCAHDPVANIVLRTGSNTSPFYFWDLKTPGSTNYEKRVSVTGSVKTFVDQLSAIGRSIADCAMDYDPHRLRYVLWCGSGQTWSVRAPNPLATTGWEIEALALPEGEAPPNSVGVGILGKWEYIPGFDVFIGLVNSVDGNIWVYKPIGWVEPTGGGGGGEDPPPPPPPTNKAPQVMVSAPVNGAVVTVGTEVELTADASDEDGSIARVVFRVAGSVVGTVSAPPYSLKWTPGAEGTYAVTAEAFDDKEANTLSAAINLVAEAVVEPPPPGEGGTVVLQRSDAGEHQVADTYLSTYHKTTNFGGSTRMDLWRDAYVPLVRFAIFASEGGPVPDGAVIKSAKLSVYKGGYDAVLSVHAMRVQWEEKEATWNRPRVGATWSVAGAAGAGADYEAGQDAQVKTEWNASWVMFDVTERVGKMSAGTSPNYGWRTYWVSGGYNRMELRSSEYTTYLDRRPKLEVEWELVAD